VIRRAAIVTSGFALLLAGAALLVLPGPGIPLVAAGLALLSLEFAWARRLRAWVVRRTERITPASRGRRIVAGCAAVAGAAGTSVAVGLWGIPAL